VSGVTLAIATAALGLAAFVTTAAVNALMMRRPGVLAVDAPGARRLHRQPTPRGGGLGIALAVVLFGLGPFLPVEPRPLAPILLATGLLAWVGWRDDRVGVPVAWRLAAHLGVAGTIVWTLAPRLPGVVPDAGIAAALAVGLLLTGLIAWSINLHNFMDGIDGLLAWQALFVSGFLVTLPSIGRDPVLLVPAVATASACLGFLPFNFPKARIFMGDVGSTVLGLMVALLLLIAVRHGHLPAAAALTLPILFVTDASLTLVSRVLRGRRWYAAHREHLYQWLARSGGSHVRVSLGFLLANLLVVAPTVSLIRAHPDSAWSIAGAAYVVAGLAWVGLRELVLRRRRRG
jgi:UDP-N-acetylmuramyl pentapeptide phosphotransferase/UDP-N-acetylglucosamine-1-phosphate transferase